MRKRSRKHLCSATAELLEHRRLLSTSDLSYHAPIDYPLGNVNPLQVTTADLRGDGLTDIITANRNGSVSILLGNSNGTFAPAATIPDGLPNGFAGVTAANLVHGDSAPDLIVTYGGPDIAILIGNGDGTFKQPHIIEVDGNISSVAAARLSGDGDMDLITADSNGAISILSGNGTGTSFSSPINTQLYANAGANYVLAGDFGNGETDLAVANSSYGSISILMGAGNGLFNPPSTPYTAVTGIVGLAEADLSGVGADIFAASSSGDIFQLVPAGGGTFTSAGAVSIGSSNLASIFVADLNGDGNPDLLLTYDNGSTGSYALVSPGSGMTTFLSPEAIDVGIYARSAVAADVYGDGFPDLIVANYGSQNVSVIPNEVNIPNLVVASQPTSATAGSSLSNVVVKIKSPSGGLDSSDNSDVTLAVTKGPGQVIGTTTVEAVHGIATFSNLSFDTSGLYRFIATDGIDNSVKTSSITVNAAAPTQLVFATQPSTVTAGSKFPSPVSVDLEDQFGNIAVNTTDTITLSGVVGPTFPTQIVQTVSGVATFSNLPALDTAGNYRLQASTPGISARNSLKFSVNIGAASKLVFIEEPMNVNPDQNEGPITVAVEDAFGNIETGDSSGSVILAAKVTPTDVVFNPITEDVVDGVATFSDATFTTVGGYRLKALQSGLLSAQSSKFYVLA